MRNTALLGALSGFLLYSASAFAMDADGDGLSDAFENAVGTNMSMADSDMDGLNDHDEFHVHGTDPNNPDTDGDSLWDSVDIAPLDDGVTYGGSANATFTGGDTGVVRAASGESPRDGEGVDVHAGRVNQSCTVGRTVGVNGSFALVVGYSSTSDRDGLHGLGWTSILDSRVTENPVTGSLTWLMPDGVTRAFTYGSTGSSYVSPTGQLWHASKDANGRIWFKRKGDVRKLMFDPASNGAGRIEKIEDRFGNATTLSYNASGQATTLTDTRGQVNTLAYYNTGRLKTYTCADGRAWTFRYNHANQLMRVEGPSSASFANGIVTRFRYMQGTGTSLDNNMTVAIDGKGQSWLEMEYDTSDRVAKQRVGDGDYTFDYSSFGSNEVTVTDRVGNDRVWTWDASKLTRSKLQQKSNRDVRTTDPTEWVTEWMHDSDGYLTSVTFPEGNGVKYTRNAQKRVTERRHKAAMTGADSATADLIHTWSYDTTHGVFVLDYTDPEGNETGYTLNSLGQPTKVTFETLDHVSPSVTIERDYTYNADGTVATFVDGEDKTTKTVYYTTGADRGRVKERTIDEGGLNLVTKYEYTAWGDVKKVTDPEGNVTEYTVEEYGNTTEVRYPASLGYVTQFEHDENLNVTKKKVKNIDETGTARTPTWLETSFAYNVMNDVTTINEDVTGSYERRTEYQYDANENRTLSLLGEGSMGHMNEWTYDERDLVYEHCRAGGGASGTTESFDYDKNGSLEQHTNNRGKLTEFECDGFGRRTRIVNALGDYTELTYDKNGNLTEHRFYDEITGASDDLMEHHKRHYDKNGRFYKEEDLLEGTTSSWLERSYQLDDRGLVIKATDRRGHQTTMVYDGAARQTNTTDHLGNEIDTTYDKNGNVTKIEETEVVPGSSSTETYTTEFTYDALNRRLTRRVVDRTDASEHKTTTWKYDSLDVVCEALDPMGHKVVAEHDGLGRVTKRTEHLSGVKTIVTESEFDDRGRVTLLRDDNGNETQYSWDTMDRLETKAYDDGTTVSYEHDANDNVTRITDQNGTVIDMVYDGLDRMTRRDATLAQGVGGDQDEDFVYDPLGRLRRATDEDSTVDYTLDSLGRVLTETQGGNPLGTAAVTVEYSHDAEGNLVQIDYPSGFESHQTYDALDRLSLIEDKNGNDIVSFDLHGARGRRRKVDFGNGASTSIAYDGFRRPTDIAHGDSLSTQFAGFEYGWDKNDNPVYEARSHQSGKGDVYAYDEVSRLTHVLADVDDPAKEVTNPGTENYASQRAYNLDEVFNFTSVVDTPMGGSASTTSYTVNGMNEYTQVGSKNQTHDANGNLTDDGTYTYEYDFHNHLIKVVDKASSTTVAEYKYDAAGRGRRIEKTQGGDTTRFVYVGDHCIEELDGLGNLVRLFVYADDWDAIVAMEADDVADVDSDGDTSETKRFYYHAQIAGSVTQITDEDEVVVESYDYDPYGEPTIYDINGAEVNDSQIGNPFLYTARRIDEETGLFYYRARHYSSALRRFIQRDPLEYVDGPNARAYVAGMPTARTDPTGLEFVEATGGGDSSSGVRAATGRLVSVDADGLALFSVTGWKRTRKGGGKRVRWEKVGNPILLFTTSWSARKAPTKKAYYTIHHEHRHRVYQQRYRVTTETYRWKKKKKDHVIEAGDTILDHHRTAVKRRRWKKVAYYTFMLFMIPEHRDRLERTDPFRPQPEPEPEPEPEWWEHLESKPGDHADGSSNSRR